MDEIIFITGCSEKETPDVAWWHNGNDGNVVSVSRLSRDVLTQGGHKPGKPGILKDFSEHGKLREFCEFYATSEKL